MARLIELRARLASMVDDLAALVSVDSPSSDPDAVARCADAVANLGSRILGPQPERAGTHLRWRFGDATRVLVLGHFDTVWPSGTVEAWPFGIRDGVVSGPGCFDMKAGIVQGLHALATLGSLDGVTVLLTSDEELGSPSSRELIVGEASGADAVLVLEPSAGGALKVARKGVSSYDVEISGRAAHAGLEPELGANATVELAHQVLRVCELARDDTTVTPTTARSGSAMNVVPERAVFHVDVRASTREEQERVDREIRRLRAVTDGTTVAVEGGPNRPPLERESSSALFERAKRIAETLGLPPLEGVAVGGGSDGNLTAGAGVPTLDGLGAVGGGAHARDEHVELAAMPERAALVAELVAELLTGG